MLLREVESGFEHDLGTPAASRPGARRLVSKLVLHGVQRVVEQPVEPPLQADGREPRPHGVRVQLVDLEHDHWG